MATKSHPDWIVLEKIGADTLIAEGISAVLVKSWRYRGVPWNMRGKIARLARSRRVRVPSDFIEHKPESPTPRRAADPATRSAA